MIWNFTVQGPKLREMQFDYIVIGGGVIRSALSREILQRDPGATLMILEKENSVGYHASGRNSGVLHAGFYYTADSLKAQFTREGNRLLKAYCESAGIPLLHSGKVVVARDERDLDGLAELERRGRKNEVPVETINLARLEELEPFAKSFKAALWSPSTATVDPLRVLEALQAEIQNLGGHLSFAEGYASRSAENEIRTTTGRSLRFKKIINTAGLYADRVAQDFGVGQDYRLLPFKGLYWKAAIKEQSKIRRNIYPVPNLGNPFLGVHFTVTVDGGCKIGPTAIPAFWRENYQGLSRFDLGEFAEVLSTEMDLFLRNSFGFRDLALEEVKKYSLKVLQGHAAELVQNVDLSIFDQKAKPGIRAQLLQKSTRKLVQDFVVEAGPQSVHVLNSVSPAFTCSLPFSKWIADNFIFV